MTTPTVILDACVLYPAALRDLLLWLAVTGLYRPRWTETNHQEWMENLLNPHHLLSVSLPTVNQRRVKRAKVIRS